MAIKKCKTIKIFINGNWHDMLNQQVYKNGKWLTFTKSCGVNKDGIWYVL